MARPFKRGITYFSLDSDIFYADDDMKGLIARFGTDGFTLYVYTLCEIYREEGYYKALNDDFEFIAAKDLCIDRGTVVEVMAYLYERKLLVKRKPALNPDGVTAITSPGIQKRFQLAVVERARRRAIIVDRGIWMLPPEKTLQFIKFAGDAVETESAGDDNPVKDDPGPFTAESVEAAFQEYLTGRGDLQPSQVAALRGKLQELSGEPAEQVKIIKEAIIHGWKSFYPPKIDKPGKRAKNKPAFYNCEQRTYDYQALEAQLLGGQEGGSDG